MPKYLPLEHVNVLDAPGSANAAQKPPLLHEMTVNTLNFCAFAACPLPADHGRTAPGPESDQSPLLLAVPHTLTSEAVDIHTLPGGARRATIPAPVLANPATGLLMALAFAGPEVLVSGYEGGHVLAYARAEPLTVPADGACLPAAEERWSCIYRSRPHSQPVLSLAPSPAPVSIEEHRLCISTAADAVVAKHRLSTGSGIAHAGFAADELVLREPGDVAETEPVRLFRTGHAGQQGARVRDDGRICATAGWDGRVRVYAGAGLREVAVLKWHKDGCYAVDFAGVQPSTSAAGRMTTATGFLDACQESGSGEADGQSSAEGALVAASESAETVVRAEPTLSARRRDASVRSKHWLAAGAKDGKVSLWEVF